MKRSETAIVEAHPDLFEGRLRKADGIALVGGNSGPEWKEQVAGVIAQLASRTPEFTSDDLRVMAHGLGLPEPHHPNAWGASVNAAARRGLIRKLGFRSSALPSTHARTIAVWTLA